MEEVEVLEKHGVKKRALISILCFLIAIILGMILSYFYVPKISLHGNRVIIVDINSKYVDKGCEATYQGKSISKDVKMTGNVDTTKPGTYKIVYTVKKGVYEKKATRTVIVKDMDKPTIELTGKEESYVCPNKTYQEEGYKAIDNYDGDITDQVVVTNKDDKVIYSVKDSSGNETVAERRIIYKDIEAPVITLIGSQTETIEVGTKYKELGYGAIDNCDDYLTDSVKVSNNIDINKPGTYEVKYEVTDKSNNKTTITRKVHIVEKATKGVIYLTFDDGPKQGTTNVILDILKEEGVTATFFVTNSGPDNLIVREYNEGHTVALHTASHNYQTVYTSVEGYFADLDKVKNRVKRLIGKEVHIIRFPGGSSNTISRKYNKGIMTTLTKEVQNRGYYYFDWNVDSEDAGGTKTASGVYKNVTKSLSKKRANVVLMHDIKPYTRDALRDIIHYGKENGYVFKSITEDTPMVTHRVNN